MKSRGRKRIDVTLVWAPMMDADSEAAAREAARKFDGKHVAQFYDAERLVGLAFRRDVFPDAFEKGLASLPEDHWLRDSLIERGSDYGDRAEWDIYMFFARGTTWGETPPMPSHFVRHLGRITKNGESLMWIDDYANPPVEGDLVQEIGRMTKEASK